MITNQTKKITAIAAVLIANCSLLNGLAEPVTVELPANSNLTEIGQTGGSLEIVSDGILLRNIPLEEVSDLTISGTNGSSDINVSAITHLNGSLTIEGSLGSVTFNGPVAVGGTTTIAANGNISVNALFSSDTGITLNAGNQIQLNNSEMTTMAGDVIFFSASDMSLMNSSINTGDGNGSATTGNAVTTESNIFIRTNASLNFADSALSTTSGHLAVNVAESMYVTSSAITVNSGSFYLNTGIDMIMDTESTLNVTESDLYANIFGDAVLGGVVHVERLFAMYVQGNFTLAETGSLDTSTAYLNSGRSIAIDGRMDTNTVNGEVFMSVQERISMKSMDPITAKTLWATSNTGIFLRTDVESLVVQTIGVDLGNGTSSAEIEIHEVDDVVLNRVYNADGPIRIMAGGTIKALQVLSNTDAPGRNIGFTSAGGDIEVGLISAGATYGQISLSARGEIKEIPDSDVDFDIVANVARIYAGASIASGDAALEIDVNELNVFEGAGVSLSIMHPSDGMTVENVRPALMAPFTASFDIRESDFRVYLNDVEYSADVMIEGDKAAFLPFFDFSEGSHTYRIDLVVGDMVLASASTTFTVNAELPNPTDTQFSGQVHSTDGVPIEGVIVHSGIQSATTDAEGRFSFRDLPYGNNLFEFDPSGAADGKKYTPVNLSFEVRPGCKTVWERPVFLAEYDPADGVNVVSNALTDQVVENPNLPGVRVVIPARTHIDFPDGSNSGVVTIVDIPVALSPNCLGAGLRPSRLISLQPENTRLSQPAQLIFPNDLDLPEGTGFDLMSLNIETGVFGRVGRASVLNNEVVTDAGSGLRTFDWHGDIPETAEIDEVNAETNDTTESKEMSTCSTMIVRTGELMEDHSTPAYYSLGSSRTTGLHYSSLIAAPEFLVNAELARSIRMAEPNALLVATSTPVGSAQSFFTPSDLALGSFASAARSMDASDLITGEYELTTRVTGLFTSVGGTDVLNSRTRKTSVNIYNGRDLYPAMGTGWSISNVSRLLFDGDGDITILSGRGRKTIFVEGGTASDFNGEESTLDNLGIELGLAGTGLSGNDGVSDDPRVIVSNLGFIQPTEGKQMLLLRNTDENGIELTGPLAISIPLQRKPFGADRLLFDLDLLANELIENGFEALSVTLNYRGVSDSLYSLTEPKSSFGDVYGDLAGSSQFSTVLAGGDSGYVNRSGFRTIGINLSDVPFGAPMCLRIELSATKTVDEYGEPLEAGVRAAALIDNLRYDFVPGSRDVVFDRIYASEAGDYSNLVFDSAHGSGIYIRSFQDGSVQKFNSSGLEISVTDRFGNETRYEYTDGDGDGEDDELARIIDPAGLVTEFIYQNGKLHRITDPANRVTEMVYDVNGYLQQILNPDGTTRSFTYDDKGRMLSQTDGESNERFYTYQPGSSRLASVTRADGQVYEYAPQQTRGLPATDTGSELVPAALYQIVSLGKNTVSIDARGIRTSQTLDSNGQPTEVVDNLGNAINMRYDSNRNRTRVTAANGEEFNFSYDAFGNMTRTVREYDGATTEIEYDTALFDLPTQITDPLGRLYRFEYDSKGNLTRTTDPLDQTSEFTYNAAGQVLTVTDKLGQVSTYTYNTLGRLVSITDELNRTVTYGYDAAGNQITVTDPQGRVTTTEYDDAGDPIRVTAPDGGMTQFSYDGNKNLLSLTDSLGRIKSWTYDERERVTSYTDALGNQTFMTYDEVGNMLTYTREDGSVIDYVYDQVNRVSEIWYPALLSGVAADKVTYTYDELYRVTNQSDNDSSIDYVFDPISRLISTTQTWNGQADTLNFAYDLVDRRVSMSDSTGTTTYAYDDLDRLINLTDSADRAFGFAYDPLNRLTRKTMANGTATDFSYDPASQLLDIITGKVGTSEVIESIAYSYNTSGTRASETRLDGNCVHSSTTPTTGSPR